MYDQSEPAVIWNRAIMLENDSWIFLFHTMGCTAKEEYRQAAEFWGILTAEYRSALFPCAFHKAQGHPISMIWIMSELSIARKLNFLQVS